MIHLVISFLVLIAPVFDREPVKLNWVQLSDMTVEYRYNDEFGFDIPYPVFGDEIKAMEGKEVTLEGFVLLIEAAVSYTHLTLPTICSV